MRLVKLSVFAACGLMAAGSLFANDGLQRPPSGVPSTTAPAVRPATAMTPSTAAPSGTLSAAEARELAAWARANAQAAGQVSSQDALELEAWARAQEQLRVEAAVRDSQVMQAAVPGLLGQGTTASYPSTAYPSGPSRSSVYHPASARMQQDPMLAEPMQTQPLPPAQGAPPAGQPELIGPDGAVVDGHPDTLWGDVCGACNTCCSSGLILGVEATFLAPVGDVGQSVIFTDLTTGQEFSGTSDPGLGRGVRAWIGMQHCNGFGYRARFWHFTDDEVDSNLCTTGEPSFVEAFGLELNTFDLELTQRFCFCNCQLETSFGGRYANLERNSTVTGFGPVGGVNLLGIASAQDELEGTGFTFSLFGRKPVVCHCGWHWFWGIRGSVLWADTSACVFTEANVTINQPFAIGSANSQNKATVAGSDSDDLFIGEAMLGLQYERCLPCCPALWFFRVAVEYQHWETGDLFAGANSFAFLAGGSPAFGGRVDTFANATDGDLDLIGLTIGTGLTY